MPVSLLHIAWSQGAESAAAFGGRIRERGGGARCAECTVLPTHLASMDSCRYAALAASLFGCTHVGAAPLVCFWYCAGLAFWTAGTGRLWSAGVALRQKGVGGGAWATGQHHQLPASLVPAFLVSFGGGTAAMCEVGLLACAVLLCGALFLDERGSGGQNGSSCNHTTTANHAKL
uniref:Uncharacterized protein n=1 Tax=Hemiselmis andersenii TaxID=464988 RepID=A0A6U4WP91_HEMAN